MTSSGDLDGSSETSRMMLTVGAHHATGSGTGEADRAPTRDDLVEDSPCDNPLLCTVEAAVYGVGAGVEGVKQWDGWSQVSQVMPFLFSSTATTSTTATTATDFTTTSSSTDTVTSTSRTTTSRTTTTTVDTSCMVLEEGDDCYMEVLGVLYDIREHPDSRDGLTRWSTFEEVQTWLHQNEKKSKCREACGCLTPPTNSHCYASLVFAMESGIQEHPEWYEGLSEKSSANDFQEYLWKYDNDTECARPCRAFPRGDPSLFCWSVSLNWGYEADVMRAQLSAGAGIFSCDGFAVVSETEWNIGRGPGGRIGEVNTLIFEGAEVGVSKDGTAGNTELFVKSWDAILERTLVLEFDWTIKVDPDAVVLADRLRDHLKDKTGSTVFVRNCNAQPDSPDFPMMFGSLEAISREALQTYKDAGHRCMNELNWKSWGEDYFLGKCLPHLGVSPADDFSIVSDGVCTKVDCWDGSAAAFHPFKGVDEWMGCWRSATANMGGPPPPLP